MKRTSQGIKGQLLEKKYKICFLSYNLMIENMFPKVKNKSSKGTVDSQRVDSLCSFSRKQRVREEAISRDREVCRDHLRCRMGGFPDPSIWSDPGGRGRSSCTARAGC